VGYALVLTSVPTILTPWVGLSGVTSTELRAPELEWLWDHIDSASY
jgi:hypothetical protein